MYPQQRLQRYRKTSYMRDLVRENSLHSSQFILPVFINENLADLSPISSLPGVNQHSLSSMIPFVQSALDVGVKAVIIFGIPKEKAIDACSAYDEQGIVQQAIRQLKIKFPKLVIIADCCLCEYTLNGHCGIMTESGVNHQKTLATLEKIALSYAKSGVDIIAPSGMMDGMVLSIRQALDTHKFESISIMSYAIKYASHFYGPFRDAAGSKQFTGDRHHHQLNPAQCKEGLLEAKLDTEEGADFLMVKPAGFYLDMINRLANESMLPIVGYHVSGEYAMVHHAATAGAIELLPALIEIYIGMKRAGTQLIVSYAAQKIAAYLQANS